MPSPILTITMSDGLVMTAELYPMQAPNTVANIVNLVQQGYYDGLEFYRVKAGFVIQTGDPTGTGYGGVDYRIRGEFSENGFENDISHTRGTLSMARYPSDYDSAGSSFFIMHAGAKYLDGEYAAFGRLIGDESYETLDIIANTPTDINEKPLVDKVIHSITVDTKGYTYTHEEIEED
ncbi:MAG: peptidylprolyl isomerase [Clostridia bacterium]|nr:peptidylprolyl isomerase [Clostridia bacterium]